MKQIKKSILLAVLFSLVMIVSFAQQKTSSQWISDKGYWVIESNKKQPMDHIVRFYNNDNVLVYKETLTGIKLKPEKIKVRRKLNKVLEESIGAWEKSKKPLEELAYVKAILN